MCPHSQRLFLLKLLRTHKSLLYLGWCWEHQHQPQTLLHFLFLLFFFNTLSIPLVPNTRLPFLTPAKPVHLEEPLHFFVSDFFFFSLMKQKKRAVSYGTAVRKALLSMCTAHSSHLESSDSVCETFALKKRVGIVVWLTVDSAHKADSKFPVWGNAVSASSSCWSQARNNKRECSQWEQSYLQILRRTKKNLH